MRDQAGQILQPDPQTGVNLLQGAAVPTLIGIIAVVPVEVLASTTAAEAIIVVLLVALRLPAPAVLLLADAEAVGLITVHAPVKPLLHRGVTMFQLQVAEADFIGILLPALAAKADHLHRQHHQAVPHQLQPPLPAEPVVALVRQAIIGCLTMAVGVCLMVLVVAGLPQLAQRLLPVNPLPLRLKQQHLLNLLLPQRQLQNLALLLPQQVNPLPLHSLIY